MCACGNGPGFVGIAGDDAAETGELLDEVSEDAESSTGNDADADPFSTARLVELPLASNSYAFGDFDNDGDDDVLLIDANGDHNDLVMFSIDADIFEERHRQYIQDSPELIAAPVGGDDGMDLVALHGPDVMQMAWEDGLWQRAPWHRAPNRVGAPIDYNRGGLVDYLAVEGSTLQLFGSDRDGAWVSGPSTGFDDSCTPVDAHWADVTGDTLLDVAVVAACGVAGRVSVYRQQEDESLTLHYVASFDTRPDQSVLADVDHDGILDVLFSGPTASERSFATVGVLTGTASGQFAESEISLTPATPASWIALLAVDADGDGIAEPFLPTPQAVLDRPPGLASVRLRHVAGAWNFDALPDDFRLQGAGDFNGDGCPDLVGRSLGNAGGVLLQECG